MKMALITYNQTALHWTTYWMLVFQYRDAGIPIPKINLYGNEYFFWKLMLKTDKIPLKSITNVTVLQEN
jgi:hypothetical protein